MIRRLPIAGIVIGTCILTGSSLVAQTGLTPPSITSQPVDQTITIGQAAQFTIVATGEPPPTYQWRMSIDGGKTYQVIFNEPSQFNGADTPTLTVRRGANGSRYRCTVTNSTGSATSNSATLTLLPIVVGDFNADRHPDLVWRNYETGQNVVWFMNDTNVIGVAWLPEVPDVNWQLTLTADFNNDGNADLMWRNPVTGQNVLWLMNGTAISSVVNLPSLVDPSWLIFGAADLNGDGYQDLLWRHGVSNQRAVWHLANGAMIGAGGLSTLDVNTDVARPVTAIDTNNDGLTDMIWRSDYAGENFISNLDGVYQQPILTVSDANWVIAATADFDADFHPDILWRNTATGENLMWHMTCADSNCRRDAVWLPSVPDTNWRTPEQLRRLEPTDLNHDGSPDILWRNSNTGDNVVWHMDGNTVVNTMGLPPRADTSWSLVGVAAHGRWFIWHHIATGDNELWRMNDTSLIASFALPSMSDLNWTLAVAVDLNADGYPDLVWRNSLTGENLVWLMMGTSIASTAALTTVYDTDWKLVAAADLNRDNHPDLIWRNRATGLNVVWYMNGTNIAGTAALPTLLDVTWTLGMATDVNGDGAPDLVWRNTSTGQNVVWYMNGTNVVATAGLPPVFNTQWQMVK